MDSGWLRLANVPLDMSTTVGTGVRDRNCARVCEKVSKGNTLRRKWLHLYLRFVRDQRGALCDCLWSHHHQVDANLCQRNGKAFALVLPPPETLPLSLRSAGSPCTYTNPCTYTPVGECISERLAPGGWSRESARERAQPKAWGRECSSAWERLSSAADRDRERERVYVWERLMTFLNDARSVELTSVCVCVCTCSECARVCVIIIFIRCEMMARFFFFCAVAATEKRVCKQSRASSVPEDRQAQQPFNDRQRQRPRRNGQNWLPEWFAQRKLR